MWEYRVLVSDDSLSVGETRYFYYEAFSHKRMLRRLMKLKLKGYVILSLERRSSKSKNRPPWTEVEI